MGGIMIRNFLTAAVSIGLFVSAPAAAMTTIDFESQSQGAIPNGYTIDGVSFYDTAGADLGIYNYAETNFTNGLYVFSDDTSALDMLFAVDSTDLLLYFGNDEHCDANSCPWDADRAFLQLFLNGTEVGNTFVLFNQNNAADQSIGINGTIFDEARLTYTNAAFQPGSLIEAVDNISFNQAAVPEPSTWAMMLIGFGAVGFSARRRRRRFGLAAQVG